MSQLFTPLRLRGLALKNRTVVSPMCQYSAVDGLANDWHLVHLGRFALGGFGLVIVEATSVTPEGRITYGDLGLWDDEQVAPLRRITSFLRAHGAAAGVQLAHAGRKASARVPWRGMGSTGPADAAEPGFAQWTTQAPSPLPHSPDYLAPEALDEAGIADVIASFVAAARRAEAAGFDVVEVHAAHGYLLNQFLSPLANKRTDRYGGTLENRMRLPLEVVSAVRAAWPQDKPLLVRISATDGHPEGWQIEDSVEFAARLKALGVDLVDCSSGGFDGATFSPRALYQVPLSAAVRREAGIPTMTLGLITEAADAEAIVAAGDADLVALARGALEDPNWAMHARHELGGDGDAYALWPKQIGYAIKRKDAALKLRA